jgi:hypothetical protein
MEYKRQTFKVQPQVSHVTGNRKDNMKNDCRRKDGK